MYEAVGHADVPQICCGSTSIRDEEMMEGEVKCGGDQSLSRRGARASAEQRWEYQI
jgi:hypothetical protein